MIIVSMGGGLGNQMFEYAFYYKLKKIYPNQIIKLDTRYAFPKAHNGIEVEKIFNLCSEKASRGEVKELIDKRLAGEYENIFITLVREIRKKIGLRKKSYLAQQDFTEYYPLFFNLNDNQSYYLLGPFCNALYFDDIEQEIQELFSFPPLDERNKKWLELIYQNVCISVHVRRGDYLQLDMGCLPNDYYVKAISYFKKKMKGHRITFLAFTDDVTYVKKNLGWVENLYIVDGNTGADSYKDMQLMSLCAHNINANSTFSFWGAYLNQNPNKIVITPAQPVNRCKYPFARKGWIMM